MVAKSFPNMRRGNMCCVSQVTQNFPNIGISDGTCGAIAGCISQVTQNFPEIPWGGAAFLISGSRRYPMDPNHCFHPTATCLPRSGTHATATVSQATKEMFYWIQMLHLDIFDGSVLSLYQSSSPPSNINSLMDLDGFHCGWMDFDAFLCFTVPQGC